MEDESGMRLLTSFKSFLPDVPGGISTAIATFASGLAPEIRTRVLTCGLPGAIPGEIKIRGITVKRTRTLAYIASNPISPGYFSAFAEECRRNELVALHVPFPQADVAVACGALNDRPLVVHWHADLVSYPRAARVLAPLIRRTLTRAQSIIISDARLIHSGSPLFNFKAKCKVVPFGVEASILSRLDDTEAMRVQALRFEMPKLVVACGRLVPYKGFDVLVDAARGLDANVVIIGAGPLEGALRAQIAMHGLQNRVRLIGAVSDADLKLWLHAADVFAFPSVTAAETFGIVQIEAMACGTPIVNTALPTSVPFVARHQREGLTVPPGDTAALRGALQLLLDDPAHAVALGAAGAKRVRSHYDRHRSVKAVGAIYRAAAG